MANQSDEDKYIEKEWMDRYIWKNIHVIYIKSAYLNKYIKCIINI